MLTTAAAVEIFRWEMVLTGEELARLAVHLPGGESAAFAPRHIAADLGDGRRWTITLGPERTRAIALLRLPVADLALCLEGFAPAARDAFLARFHSVFRKGGG